MAEKYVKHSFDENIDFLQRFYEAKEVQYQSVGEKIAGSLGIHKSKKQKLVEIAEDLKSEGSANEVIIEDDIFEVDTEEYLSTKRRKLSNRTKVSLFLLLVMIPVTLIGGLLFVESETFPVAIWLDQVFGSRKYYFISLVIVIYSLIPFFMVFEDRKPQARELIVLATLAGIATAGRGAFFMLPHFKPLVAVVIISGISFGAESGFLVGAVTMIVSNMLFGQGPWTPWQMLALGMIGFISGLLHRVGLLPAKRMTLCIYGFLMTVFVYGGIMNPASVVMSVYEVTWESLLAAYISGIPVDLVHATSTFLFLWVGAKPLIEKLQRIKVKYGML